MWLLVLASSVVYAPFTAATESRFELTTSAGAIDGPGEGYTSIFNRRIKDIDSGERGSLAFNWSTNENVTLGLSWAESRLRYDSPLNLTCPLSAEGIFNSLLCITQIFPRDAQRIEESMRELSFGVGYQRQVRDWLTLHSGISVIHAQWSASNDIEAEAVARCYPYRDSPFGFVTTRRVPGCTPFDSEASELGIAARLGAQVQFGNRIDLKVMTNYQDFRHRVWRVYVADEFYERFCAERICATRADLSGAGVVPERSWTWLSAELGYRFTDHWKVTLGYEGGGTRTWEIATLGVTYSWN
jgi:hypothetical protein